MSLSRFALAVCVSLLWSTVATSAVRAQQRAVNPSRIESVRGIALGTGARASAVSSHALADNPANLTRGGLYHLEAFAMYDPTYRTTSLGSAVVDSNTSKLAAGFSMRGLLGKNSAGRNSGYDGRLGLAYPILDALSVGLAFRYADIRVPDPDGVDEDPDPDIVDQRYKLKHFTMDAAISINLESLTISGLAYNMVDTDSALAPVLAGGSLAYAAEMLSLGGEVLVEVKTFDSPKLLAGGGLEYLVGGKFPMRGGYRYDQGRNTHSVTAGLGYVDDIVGLQAGLRQSLNGAKETSLVFALQYFVR